MSIDVKNLSFSFSKNKVLDNISFSAQKGDFLCVLGKNGAGKTTLFRCLLGFIKYQGEISVDSRNICKMTARELSKKIAYIPQSSTPVFSYTVLDCVQMGMTGECSVFSSPTKEMQREAMDILRSLSIDNLCDNGTANISSGELALTMLARALAQKAKILIMDEPCASLDFSNRRLVMDKVKALTHNGYTVIMSTHDPNQALMYADKVLALKGSRVLSFGKTQETVTEDMLSELYEAKIKLLHSEGTTFCIAQK